MSGLNSMGRFFSGPRCQRGTGEACSCPRGVWTISPRDRIFCSTYVDTGSASQPVLSLFVLPVFKVLFPWWDSNPQPPNNSAVNLTARPLVRPTTYFEVSVAYPIFVLEIRVSGKKTEKVIFLRINMELPKLLLAAGGMTFISKLVWNNYTLKVP